MPTVAMIGLGKMGMPIAGNLIDRGFHVVGFRRHPSAELTALGGSSASTAAEAAENADVIVSILPDYQAIHAVLSGPTGTLTTMRPGTVHIEMSTIDVAAKLNLRDAVRSAGSDMLDCPISGSPAMVRPRHATPFASGDRASVEAVTDVLDAIAGPWIYTGEFGTGAWMKYIANLLVAVHTVATAEALTLARRSGLDLHLVQATLNDSIASSAIWRQRGPVMQRREWSPAPGPVHTLHDILEQIEQHATSLGLTLPVFASAKATFDRAITQGRADLDIASVYDQIEPVEDAQ